MSENICEECGTDIDGTEQLVDDLIASKAALTARLAETERERDEARASLKRVQAAAITGMNASKAVSSAQLAEAARLHADSSPEAVASQREANELLTNENDELRAEVARLEMACNAMAQSWKSAESRLAALREAVEKSPHSSACLYLIPRSAPLGETRTAGCNCWKREALGKSVE
jgi:chromosome segregation ATPase